MDDFLWRVDPVLFGVELGGGGGFAGVVEDDDDDGVEDGGGFQVGVLRRFAHTGLLGRKFADAALGVSRRQIWVCPPRYGKPVQVDTLVLMGDGSRRRLGDVVVGDRVVSGWGRVCRVLAVHEQGVLSLVRVVTHSGRVVSAAADHPFLTTEGWVDAGDLRSGHVLALRLRPATVPSTVRDDAEFRMAGYFVGDGSCGTGQSGKSLNATITNADPGVIEDIGLCCDKLGWRARVTRFEVRAPNIGISGGVRDWLREVGLAGHTSYTKRVPEFVFRAPVGQVAQFLGAYFACDGNISWRRVTEAGNRVGGAEFYSVNPDLLRDVQHLLLRVGVRSRLAPKKGQYKGKVHDSWRLTISSDSDIARFLGAVQPAGAKGAERLTRVAEFDRPFLEDEVVDVSSGGEGECRCLTVETDGTWLAEDLVVHNTTVASQWGPAWFLEMWPHKRVILASYNDRLARRNGRVARDLLTQYAPRLSVRLKAGQRAADEWDTTAGGGLLAAGVGSSMTGFGADLLIVDDPVKNMKEVESQQTRDDIWGWYTSTARTRLHRGGAVIVVATRWHKDDLTGRLLAADRRRVGRGLPPLWEVVWLPAIADSELTGGPDLLGREDGEVLCPDLFPAAEVLEARDETDELTWRALFQGAPTSVGGDLFHRDWWQHFWARPEPHTVWRWTMSWDMAFKDSRSSSYVVGQVWANIGADHYLLEQVRGRWDYPRTRMEMVRLYQRWPQTTRIMVEDKANGPAIMADLGTFIAGFEPINPVGTKLARAHTVTPIVRSGHVWLPAPGMAPWVEDYLTELADYPNVLNDDQVDATSQYLSHVGGVLESSQARYGRSAPAR